MGTPAGSWAKGLDAKVDPVRDALYNFDPEAQKATSQAQKAKSEAQKAANQKPEAADPNYYKSVRISPTALIKMVMHARSGGSLEVMGMMQGYADGTALVVTDAFRLPVEGTETRVNAQEEANEYLIGYLDLCRAQGRLENVIGWYHSHPGYGCWLSGIDVSTQALQQAFNDPFVAVVVDPDRTISASKVEIGAFRTYPEDYKPSDTAAGITTSDGFQAVPQNKAEDFGAHSSRYYSLDVEHFKGSLDARLLELLWNKYWVQTLSQNPLLNNRDYTNKQMLDIGHKINEVSASLQRSGRAGGQAGGMGMGMAPPWKALNQAAEKVQLNSKLLAARERSALMAGETKAQIFAAGTSEDEDAANIAED